MQILRKVTSKLFMGKYQYKIVLVVAGASWFRSCNLDSTIEHLNNISLTLLVPNTQLQMQYRLSRSAIKTPEDLDYAFKLEKSLRAFNDFELRVESPWVSVYTNDKLQVDSLINLDPAKVKYISEPPTNTALSNGVIIMPKINFEYRVTLSKTNNNHSAFITWADSNKNLKLTKSCKKSLEKDRSWGGTHFYVTGDKNLLMAKMHLGGAIAKVEKILKQ